MRGPLASELAAEREAWCAVHDGFTKALAVSGLGDEERARLTRLQRHTGALAGVRAVRVVKAEEPRVAQTENVVRLTDRRRTAALTSTREEA